MRAFPGRSRTPLLIAFAIASTLPNLAQAQVGQVNGTVLDANSRHLAGVSVALIPKDGSTIYGTSSGPDGRYAFKGLRANTYSLVVLSPRGHIVRKDGVRVRDLFRSIIDVRIPNGTVNPSLPTFTPAAGSPGNSRASFSWKLTGPDRDPIPGAVVKLIPVDEQATARQGRTEADGRRHFDAVPAGTYKISVRATGFITWALGPVTLAGGHEMDLALSLRTFPMKFRGTIEDLLIPLEPIPPRTDPSGTSP